MSDSKTDAHVIDLAAPLHVTKCGKAALLGIAEQRFDAVIAELQAMRQRFVAAGDHESLGGLASNLEVEVF